jgi:hypothetical protein
MFLVACDSSREAYNKRETVSIPSNPASALDFQRNNHPSRSLGHPPQEASKKPLFKVV